MESLREVSISGEGFLYRRYVNDEPFICCAMVNAAAR